MNTVPFQHPPLNGIKETLQYEGIFCINSVSIACITHVFYSMHADLQDPLPKDMPAHLYFRLSYLLRIGDYPSALEPYFKCFPPEKCVILFIPPCIRILMHESTRPCASDSQHTDNSLGSALEQMHECASCKQSLQRVYTPLQAGHVHISLSSAQSHPHSILVVNFLDYKNYPETVVEEVLRFVGADMSKWKYQPLPPAMKVGGIVSLPRLMISCQKCCYLFPSQLCTILFTASCHFSSLSFFTSFLC